MSNARPFPARVVRQDWARRTVTAMTDSQDESGVDLYHVALDPEAYADAPPALYVYRQSRDDVAYTGIVCDVAVQAVADGRVRGHEAVDQLRVDALVWHHSRTDSPPALVTLLHRAGPEFTRAVAEAQQTEPVLDFAGPQGFRQTLWRIDTGPAAEALVDELAAAEIYIADGHHRAAAALEEWRLADKPPEAGLLCVLHPMDGLSLSAFHRRVSGPVDAARLLALLGEEFGVQEVAGATDAVGRVDRALRRLPSGTPSACRPRGPRVPPASTCRSCRRACSTASTRPHPAGSARSTPSRRRRRSTSSWRAATSTAAPCSRWRRHRPSR